MPGQCHVTIRHKDHGNLAWVEASPKPWDRADSKVVASIDLMTSDFRAEFEEKPAWAALGTGEVLGAGQTWKILWLLEPW